MSYILDALRKADAERDRGNVPGIHAQPSFGGAAPAGTQPATRPWLWLAAGALAALLAGALAWYVMSPSRGAAEAPRPTPIAVAPSPAPAPAPAPIVAPVPVAAPVEAAKPKSEPAPTARKPKPAAPAASAGAGPAAGTQPAASGEKVYALSELPDDIRRQLPTINVGGSMYATKPADRILIVNGQVLHEGDRIAPDLVLQQIRVKGALLNFKGYPYTIAF